MILSKLLPVVVGLGAGILVSAGVFTVLLSVGLVPRFAGKTHTGEKIFLYEEMVVFGTLVGCLASVFPGAVIFGREWLQKRLEAGAVFEWLVLTAEALTGLFAGIFVGCLALAIAEMLDSIPILTRFSARTRADGDFHCDGKSGWKPVVFLASYFSVKTPLQTVNRAADSERNSLWKSIRQISLFRNSMKNMSNR